METHHSSSEKRRGLRNIHLILTIVIVFLAFVNLWLGWDVKTTIAEKTMALREAAAPAKIEMAVLTAQSCRDCEEYSAVIQAIQNAGVNVTAIIHEEYPSTRGNVLAEKYQISRVPALIVKGEVQKSAAVQAALEGATIVNGAHVLTPLQPPFLDAASGKVRPKTMMVALFKENCLDCYDLAPVIGQLRAQLKLDAPRQISIDSPEGKELVKKYDIRLVPTLVFDKEASLYPTLAQVWENVGTVEEDGHYVMRNVNPPYYNVSAQNVQGLLTLTVVKDRTCATCYNTLEYNKPILRRLGLTFKEERQLEVGEPEGRNLITTYNITALPTIILTGDLNAYPFLKGVWPSVGSIEDDGAYVFRKVDLFGLPYKDLAKNEVVTPAPAEEATVS